LTALEDANRSMRLVTGVIASAASFGKRDDQNVWQSHDSHGSTAVRQQCGDLKQGGCQVGGQPQSQLNQGLGRHGGQGQRPVVDLAPPQRRREAVDDRGHAHLHVLGGAALHGEQVPGGLAVVHAPRRQVDLHDPVGDVDQVGLDAVEAVLVGVEEEAAVSAAGQMEELVDQRLGLAEAAASGHVAEHRVLQAHPDDPVPVWARHPAQGQQVPAVHGELRQALRCRWDDPA
jgi:hypothetical protein